MVESERVGSQPRGDEAPMDGAQRSSDIVSEMKDYRRKSFIKEKL
jgi:hypothetical protein